MRLANVTQKLDAENRAAILPELVDAAMILLRSPGLRYGPEFIERMADIELEAWRLACEQNYRQELHDQATLQADARGMARGLMQISDPEAARAQDAMDDLHALGQSYGVTGIIPAESASGKEAQRLFFEEAS